MTKTANREAKRHMSHKMRRLDPNDSDVLREFSRKSPETGRPLFKMPEGTYKKVGERYIRQNKSE